MKTRLTKLFTVLLTAMLVVGMTPATGSAAYAASWNSGSSFSSWFSGLFGGSSDESTKTTESNDLVSTFAANDASEATSNDTSGTADDIVLTKTAKDKGTKDGNQIFDVTLGVKGKQVSTARPIDITLVIDTSGSMADKDKMGDTKVAASNFVDAVLTEGSSARISLVDFANNAYAARFYSSGAYRDDASYEGDYSFYSSNAQGVKDAIEERVAGGATNTEAGAVMAKRVTDSRSDERKQEADSIVIFLTDGVPTLYSNGSTKDNSPSYYGTVCTNECFKKAASALSNLKKGNSLYSIGFLTDFSEGSDRYNICEAILSDTAYYEPDIAISNYSSDTGYKRVSFTKDTTKSANFTKYYGITKDDNASEKIKSIYAELAEKVNALASGTIVDRIPSDFILTDEAIAAIEADPNAEYDATNNTVTYTNIEAGKDTVYRTFEVKYVGNGYGAAYTNVDATYSGKLYDGTEFNKHFPKPVAGLHPKTVDDSDSTSVGTTITVDVKDNDPFEILTVDGYTVSNYEIVLTDKDGNPVDYTGDFTATMVDGKLQFTSTTAGTKELYYVVKANIDQIGDNFAEAGQTALKSRPTKVTIDVYDAANKAFVVDFGKPVTYSADDVFTASEQKATITLPDGSGTYGNMTLNSNKSITYTLKKFMDGIDVFTFNEAFSDKVKLDKTVTMVPATSIYYEDNFEVENEDGTKSLAITYDNNWSLVDKDTLDGDSITNVIGDGEVGYDTNYNQDDSKLSYSAGTIHMVTAPTTATAKASFEFTGTGVDIYSLTNGQTGKIQVAVWKQNSDGTYPKTAVYRKTIDTKYNSGQAYQLPVVNFDGDETPATYKVQITVGKGQTFYLDAVRIYNPIGNVNSFYGEESGVKYVSIRKQSLTPSEFTVTGDVFIDAYLENDAKNITLSADTSEEVINEYTNYGRKTEVVIAPGKTVTLKLTNSSSLLQLGARIDAQAPAAVAGGSAEGKVMVNGKSINVNSSTDMYYTISADSQNNIAITNNTDKLIAITNLKMK